MLLSLIFNERAKIPISWHEESIKSGRKEMPRKYSAFSINEIIFFKQIVTTVPQTVMHRSLL